MSAAAPREPIVAIATASGRGAVGIVRVSGRGLAPLVERALRPRARSRATRRYVPFLDAARRADRPRPGDPLPGAAFLHRRGRARTAGPRRPGGAAAAAGALPGGRGRDRSRPAPRLPRLRLARPGEFTERAFLNDKLDLAQAEAVADLIDASTEAAARSAGRSLDGAFSREIDALRRRARRAAHAGRGDARLSPRRRSTSSSRPTRAAGSPSAQAQLAAVLATRAPGRAAARRHPGRARRPAERRQELAAQRAGRRRAGDRHADSRHHARQGRRDDPDRRRAGARDRHRRPARGAATRSSAIGIARSLGGDRRAPTRCCSCTT